MPAQRKTAAPAVRTRPAGGDAADQLVAGLVLSANASFANNYVADQLSQQNITFKTADALTDEEKQAECLVPHAGQKLTTGKQAECYANNFIGLHLKSTANGQTYAELGVPQSQLRTQIAQAETDNAPNLADLQKQLADVTSQRETLFKGETLRGLLLTSYGFSEFGTKAGQAATVAYVAASLMLLLAIAGFLHALVTPRSKAFAAPDLEPSRIDDMNTGVDADDSIRERDEHPEPLQRPDTSAMRPVPGRRYSDVTDPI